MSNETGPAGEPRSTPNIQPGCDEQRRRFVVISTTGALGILLSFRLGSDRAAVLSEQRPFDAWVEISPDARVVLRIAKAEMGQGVLTSLAQLLAEELDVNWASVEVRQAPIDPTRYDHLTVGSASVQSLWLPLRRAGALARDLFIRAAAEQWNAAAAECRTESGMVVGPQGQRVSYGQVAMQAAALAPAAEPRMKRVSEFRLIGRPLPRVEGASKVDGSAVFGLDVRLPGLLYAVVVRCPGIGGRLRSFDSAAASILPGVRKISVIPPVGRDAFTRGGIAIVAQTTWAALEARRRLTVEWDETPGADLNSDSILTSLRRNTDTAGSVVQSRGRSAHAANGPRHLVEGTFEFPFLAHATMEPMNATAWVRADAVEAWLPTQNAADARAAMAKVLNRPPNSVVVHQTLLGGGLGRRDATDFAVEAAQVSALVDAPVQLVWTREDDLSFDRYRPAAVHRIQASLESRGLPESWVGRLSSVSIDAFLSASDTAHPEGSEVGGAADLPYDIPSFQLEYTPLRCPVPVGWWRSVANSINAFAVECFLDELAAITHSDPVRYRLDLLPSGRKISSPDGPPIETDRLKRVLRAVAHLAKWGQEALPGRARGVACHSCRGSYIAMVAEVSLSSDRVRVHRLWAAVDCGTVVNPLGVEAQIAGGLQFGTSAALYEAITFKSGRPEQSNFGNYRLLRMTESPTTEVRIVPSTRSPTGVGEIAVPTVAPAVANALFQLTGKRHRVLPLRI